MQINLLSQLSGAESAKGIAVVIDVFRCFTTQAIAFQNGASEIILVAEIEEAKKIKREGLGDVLLGEVGGKKPEGFDFGNSPTDILNEDFSGKTLIHSTRAGTVGATSVKNADIIYGGSFAVASATVKCVKMHQPNTVSLVAMGLEGKIRTDEDEQCGLYLRNLLQGRFPDQKAVRSLILTSEESEKYDHPDLTQWPESDREIALTFDSHQFGIRIFNENGNVVSRPEYI
ncbi:MAG: 2-phosphosulfolactate phosphatase [Dehalococcoidia bacterium]